MGTERVSGNSDGKGSAKSEVGTWESNIARAGNLRGGG